MLNRPVIIGLFAIMSKMETISAQYALPTFHAVHKRAASLHPGFGVTGLTFDNHAKFGTGDDCISIPWSNSLKEFTADDSTSFTVSIRCYLPFGSHYYRRNDYYTTPSHTLRGAYYYDGGKRLLSGVLNSSGGVSSDLEYGIITPSSTVANHTTTWSGKYSENIQSIYYDSNYWYWIGYRGTADPSTGVFTSSDTGVKLWMKKNGNSNAYNPNKTMSDVLVESASGGEYDFIRVTYSSLSDMTSGNSGTIVSTGLGSTGVGTGNINYVLDMDGTNDYVDMGSPDLGIDTTVTFSAWIYPEAENGVIAMQGFSHAGNEHGWVVAIGWDDWASSESDPRDLVWASHDNSSNANNAMLVASPALITMNQWQHIAVTKDGTEIKMYLDGELIHTESIAATTITYNEGTNLRLGARTASCASYFSSSFNGRIDEVRIWDDVRTAAEIADNKDDELVGNENGLVAYYKMSDGSGTALTDNSSNSNNGTLTNMVTTGSSTDWTTSNAPIAYDNVYTDYGPSHSYSANSIYFYLNGSLVKSHGLTNTVDGSTSGTGYLGQNIYDWGGGGRGPYTRLEQVTEWVLLSYCDPSSVSSLHSSQGSSDLRIWSAAQSKPLAIYYSLTDAITDGDIVEDLSGNVRNGTAVGFGN